MTDKQKKRVPCAVMSRVVGYYSVAVYGDQDRWNKGKAQEFRDRRTYEVPAREEMGDG